MGHSKYSNEMKVYCIDNGLVDLVRNKTKSIYHNEDGEEALSWFWYIRRHKELDCSNRLLESKYRKFSRARKHIEYIVNNYDCVFITLTFTDDVLKKTSADTRRKYVARFLKQQCNYYVGNIDYSPSKQREHYHAVVNGLVDMTQWQYGFCWVERVRKYASATDRVSHYITKLTSHAFKVDCSRLLYSRLVV